MPEAVLRLIGPEGLEKIADQARRDCLSEHIRRAITRWYANEAKTGRVKSLIDLGAAMGCSKATASRYVRGQIRQTDLLQADLYLRRLGMSLKSVLPNEDEIRFAILAATIRVFHQARAASHSDCQTDQLITPEQVQAIERINRACPFTEAVTQSEARWREWLSKAAACVRAAFPSAKWPEGGPNKFTWEICAALMAADWQTARKYLPWQVFAVLTSVIEVAYACVETNADQPDESHLLFLFHPTETDSSVQYAPVEHEPSITLSELRRVGNLPVVMLALSPRPERMSKYGREFTECWIGGGMSIEESTISVSFNLEIAIMPKSEEQTGKDIAGELSEDAVEVFYLDGLFEKARELIEVQGGEVRGCRRRRIAPRHWALDVEAMFPTSLTMWELQSLVNRANQVKLALARDVSFRLHFCELNVWEDMWRNGAIGEVRLWQDDGNEPLVHRAEFWTAVWGEDEVSVWALFRVLFDDLEGGDVNDELKSLLQRFEITPDRILEWRRESFVDADEAIEDCEETSTALRNRRSGSNVDYDCVFAPRSASRKARLVIARARLLCMKYGHQIMTSWHIALALSTVDHVATRLTEMDVSPTAFQAAVETELLLRHPVIVPMA